MYKSIDQEALKRWADNTAKGYVGIAAEEGKNAPAFYTQSDLTKLSGSPEVMILGINPGSEGTYEAQKSNPNWGLNGADMDGEHLILGNYCKDATGTPMWENRERWVYWQRLKHYFHLVRQGNPLEDEGKFVVTNMSFFSTPKANELSGKLLLRSMSYSLELINILKPRRIIFLSGKKSLARLRTINKGSKSFLLEYHEVGKSIYEGELEGIPCLGVPHPSAHLTATERRNIEKVIADFMNDEQSSVTNHPLTI